MENITGEHYSDLDSLGRCGTAFAMLPWEELVMKYMDHSNDHVLYRVTPYFKGKELLARGVEMEAYSVEDHGDGVCFHVFVYNVQPGIELDYKTGKSKKK